MALLRLLWENRAKRIQKLFIRLIVAAQREVVGVDVVEFAPIDGFHVYDYTSAEVTYKMMGSVARNRKVQETK